MAAARRHRGVGACACPCVGLVHEHDGHEVVCGIFPCKSSPISRLLCDSPDTHSTDFVCIEEVGLLDRMAVCEHSQPDPLPEGRPGVHADRQLSVPGQRHMVAVHMVQALPQRRVILYVPGR